ncbi:hypothetical protein [Clostridium polynesiense]|uniref:hypothetical protein n=1 Tax=Clostridium polynesiense TaxID=1325933 RepID=UPI00059145D2|nr:hypothetical protein [Clostridium polynesiense]
MSKTILRCLLGSFAISIAALLISSLAVTPAVFISVFIPSGSKFIKLFYFFTAILIFLGALISYYLLGINLKKSINCSRGITALYLMAVLNLILVLLTFNLESVNPALSKLSFNIFLLFNVPAVSILCFLKEAFSLKYGVFYSLLPAVIMYLGLKKA